MKRIKFTRTELYESDGRNKGPTYREGSTHDFEDAFAERWLRRGSAVEVDTREPLPADELPAPAPTVTCAREPAKTERAAEERADAEASSAQSPSQPLGTARKTLGVKK